MLMNLVQMKLVYSLVHFLVVIKQLVQLIKQLLGEIEAISLGDFGLE